MSNTILYSKKIFTEHGVISGGIVIDRGKISKVSSNIDELNQEDGSIIDVGDNLVIPGLIDIHIHGCGGWSAEGIDKLGIIGMSKYLASRGITSFQPTVGGGTVDSIKESLINIKNAIESYKGGAKILGIHMEGPFLNPQKKGAFSEENLLHPSADIMQEFIEASGNNIIHVTVAPELDGADDLISFLIDKNILVSGGHTNASSKETKKAIDNGVRLSNHTCNAQKSIHHREPGALGAYLLDDRVDCELICDLFHVHEDMIRLILKLKSSDKVCMISDSILAGGLKPDRYKFLDRERLVDNEGWCRLKDGTIAGSTKDLMTGVKNIVNIIGYPLEDTLKMAGYNPARISGYSSSKGSIEEGKDADIVVIDNNFDVKYTFVEGNLVFDFNTREELTNPNVN